MGISGNISAVSGAVVAYDAEPLDQYVWGMRYIDAAVVRFQDANQDGDYNDPGDSTLYYMNDANMNVTALADTSAAVQERYHYDAYGKPTFLAANWTTLTTQSSPSGNPILYAGYHYDQETGLYNVRHRTYHPTLGRWMQTDPKDRMYGPTLEGGYHDGMNLYEYVGSGPVVAVDPMGLAGGGYWYAPDSAYGRILREASDISTARQDSVVADNSAEGSWTRPIQDFRDDMDRIGVPVVDSAVDLHEHYLSGRGGVVLLGSGMWTAIRRTNAAHSLMDSAKARAKGLARRTECDTSATIPRRTQTRKAVAYGLGQGETLTNWDIALGVGVGSFMLSATTFCDTTGGTVVESSECSSGCGCLVTVKCGVVFTVFDKFTFETYRDLREQGWTRAEAGTKAVADAVLMAGDMIVLGTLSGNWAKRPRDFYMVGEYGPVIIEETMQRCK